MSARAAPSDDAVAHAPDDAQVLLAARRAREVGGERRPRLQIVWHARVRRQQQAERRRHHADHRRRPIVDEDLASDDRWIGAEAALEEGPAEEDRRPRARHAVLGVEVAAERGRGAEDVEEIVGDQADAQLLRLGLAGQRHRIGPDAAEGRRPSCCARADRAAPAPRAARADSPRSVMSDQTKTRRPASRYGSGAISSACTMLKMALLAPMPSASVSTTTAVKPGALRSAAPRVAERPSARLEAGTGAAGADALLHRLAAAEREVRRAARLLSRHAGRDVAVLENGERGVDLVVEIAFDGVAAARLRQRLRRRGSIGMASVRLENQADRRRRSGPSFSSRRRAGAGRPR